MCTVSHSVMAHCSHFPFFLPVCFFVGFDQPSNYYLAIFRPVVRGTSAILIIAYSAVHGGGRYGVGLSPVDNAIG